MNDQTVVADETFKYSVSENVSTIAGDFVRGDGVPVKMEVWLRQLLGRCLVLLALMSSQVL
ncbi:hypothetical protein NXY15_05450 [Bacteroides thetaiotaomicron]|nr:hypothetical protein NXY15_05450 [Bacteroides thetaiotaomicron]